MMDTRQRLKEFMETQHFIDVTGVADLVGISYSNMYKWMSGTPSTYIGAKVKRFLDTDGRRLVEITQKLKGERKDRIALHQQRAEIMKKARIHQTSNQDVPSLTIND